MLSLVRNIREWFLFQWLMKIKPVEEMNNHNKAALYAIKGLCNSLYDLEGLEASITLIKMAISKDEETPYWTFLKGKFLQQQRRSDDVPSLAEKEAFEYAHKKDDANPYFMVYHADTLRDTCKNSSKRDKSYLWFIAKSNQVNVENEINKKYQTALDLYR